MNSEPDALFTGLPKCILQAVNMLVLQVVLTPGPSRFFMLLWMSMLLSQGHKPQQSHISHSNLLVVEIFASIFFGSLMTCRESSFYLYKYYPFLCPNQFSSRVSLLCTQDKCDEFNLAFFHCHKNIHMTLKAQTYIIQSNEAPLTAQGRL